MTSGRREILILGGAGIAAAAAGFLVGPALIGLGGGEPDPLRATSFFDLAGNSRRIAEWQGRVLACNFWATWCAPCREEIPLLMATRDKYLSSGFEVVGIAIDNAAKVRQYSSTVGISYPILLADTGGLELMHRLGNISGGLPYTVVLDPKGRPIYRKLGALRQGDLDAVLPPLAKA
jgi:thiol-disulfide isomerase/thioredoxin